MRSKFICNSVEDYAGQKQANLNAVCGGPEENYSSNKATPSGHLTISINKEGAMNYFEPGKEYYLDFTVAPQE